MLLSLLLQKNQSNRWILVLIGYIVIDIGTNQFCDPSKECVHNTDIKKTRNYEVNIKHYT